MDRNEREAVAVGIIAMIDTTLKKCKPLKYKFDGATKIQKKKIIRDVLNHYINIRFIPEKAEGLAIEKAIGMVMDYMGGKK